MTNTATANAGKPSIEFFCGRTRMGQIFYAYIAVRPEKKLKYHAHIAMRKPINVMEFGEVIECGFGCLPPAELRGRMTSLGVNHAFETDIIAARRAG